LSIIDEGYVGPLYVMVWNPTFPPKVISSTERVAQLILIPYATPTVELVDSLPETVRGTNGFGSTG
jgi:dUTP pyrophosphatase